MIRAFNLLFVFFSSVPNALCADGDGFCWGPGSNFFSGQPRVERLDSDRVRIDWSDIFEPNKSCENVDFLIKSNPRHSPSDYKLSDFTLKGQTSATLMVTDGEDFVFQVIAREDKGLLYGIEYKYSQMVTSYFREETAPDVGFKELPTTEKLRVTRFRRTSTVSTTSTTSRTSSTQGPPEPQICPPLSPLPSSQIIKDFVAHMNKNSIRVVGEFMQDRKRCSSGEGRGFRIECPITGTLKCCSSPWGGGCFSDYAECDGSCIPKEWVSDNWPDCLDGSDEPGSDLAKTLHCLSCGGAVVSVLRLCQSSSTPNLESCAKNMLQEEGNCESCLSDYTLQ